MSTSYKLDDVFGISRDVPATYVSRPSVDIRFVDEISRHQHIVIYGSSKQGKTSLRKTCLQQSDYVAVQCASEWTKRDLYLAILKSAGVRIKDERKTQLGLSGSVTAAVGGTLGFLGVAKATAKGETEGRITSDSQTIEKYLELDPSSANDVIRTLHEAGFHQFIVVEDFHYLDQDVQKEFAFDLKAFFELSKISFIIIGVWLEADRLVIYNGDLAGRIVSIPADTWSESELRDVIIEGEKLLGITFSEILIKEIINKSQKNVGLLQEACRKICQFANILVTQSSSRVIEDVALVDRAFAEVSSQQSARYGNIIHQFSEGLRDVELHIYKWIMHAVICATADRRAAGLKAQEILTHVNEVHPKRKGLLTQANVTQALKNVAKVQHHAKMKPIVFDYDETHLRLRIVDSGFQLYLSVTPRENLVALLPKFNNEQPAEEVPPTPVTPNPDEPWLVG